MGRGQQEGTERFEEWQWSNAWGWHGVAAVCVCHCGSSIADLSSTVLIRSSLGRYPR